MVRECKTFKGLVAGTARLLSAVAEEPKSYWSFKSVVGGYIPERTATSIFDRSCSKEKKKFFFFFFDGRVTLRLFFYD